MVDLAFVASLLAISLNAAFDTQRPLMEWERIVPLHSVYSMVEDISDIVLGRSDEQWAIAYPGPETGVTINSLATLNSAALLASSANLFFASNGLGFQLLILNATCSWLARRVKRARCGYIQCDSLPPWKRSAIDILSAFLSYAALFSILTPVCGDDIFAQTATFAIWFLPLGIVLVALPLTQQTGAWMRLWLDGQAVFWYSVACLLATSDICVHTMLRDSTRFAGLHPLQGWAVAAHHVAFLFLAVSKCHPRGSRSWPYAMLVVSWLGLVAFYHQLPRLAMPEGPRCIASGA